jgi:hypothetical protein
MNFTSQICTTEEQSKRLLALGLRPETADMSISTRSFDTDNGIKYSLIPYSECKYRIMYNVIPAWSLHRLLCLLPTEYIADIDFQHIMQDFVFRSKDMYDEVIRCIETLIKEGYFYKEYLEE